MNILGGVTEDCHEFTFCLEIRPGVYANALTLRDTDGGPKVNRHAEKLMDMIYDGCPHDFPDLSTVHGREYYARIAPMTPEILRQLTVVQCSLAAEIGVQAYLEQIGDPLSDYVRSQT